MIFLKEFHESVKKMIDNLHLFHTVIPITPVSLLFSYIL